jgi:hypothetical protein
MPFPQQQRAAALLINDDLATSIENCPEEVYCCYSRQMLER